MFRRKKLHISCLVSFQNSTVQIATISIAMIKFWPKFYFQILWYSFTVDNSFLLTPSLISPRKIPPPVLLGTSTTAFMCIFSSILNSIKEGWKCRCRELFCHPKKTIIRKQTFSWNLHETFLRHLHEMSQPSGQNQQNGKRTYCWLPPQSFRINFKGTPSYISMDS